MPARLISYEQSHEARDPSIFELLCHGPISFPHFSLLWATMVSQHEILFMNLTLYIRAFFQNIPVSRKLDLRQACFKIISFM